MFDLNMWKTYVDSLPVRPLFVTVSGAHLYGFESPDSDVDLRGCHLLPLREVVGLRKPNETFERSGVYAGLEVDLVSHDAGKYFNLLVKNNGYVLEQIFSPLVVTGHEFLEREDGYRGLVKAYGLPFAAPPQGMELSLIYRALADGAVDLVAGDATSALIERFDLVPLADSRHYFPPYDAVPIVRTAALMQHDEIRRAVARLAGRISEKDMRALNRAVDVDKKDPKSVAREFLDK